MGKTVNTKGKPSHQTRSQNIVKAKAVELAAAKEAETLAKAEAAETEATA